MLLERLCDTTSIVFCPQDAGKMPVGNGGSHQANHWPRPAHGAARLASRRRGIHSEARSSPGRGSLLGFSVSSNGRGGFLPGLADLGGKPPVNRQEDSVDVGGLVRE